MRLQAGGRKLWINSWAGGGGGRGQAVRVWPAEAKGSRERGTGEKNTTEQLSLAAPPTPLSPRCL